MTDSDLESFAIRVPGYTDVQLLEIARGIDKDKYPDRYTLVLNEIKVRTDNAIFNPNYSAKPNSFRQYRTFLRRCGAYFLDRSIVNGTVTLIVVKITGATTQKDLIGLSIFTTLILEFYIIAITSILGFTLGKYLCGVKVVSSANRSKISVNQSVFREIPALFIYSVAVLIFSFPSKGLFLLAFIVAFIAIAWEIIDILTCLIRSDRRSMHDIFSGTVCIVRKITIDTPIKSTSQSHEISA